MKNRYLPVGSLEAPGWVDSWLRPFRCPNFGISAGGELCSELLFFSFSFSLSFFFFFLFFFMLPLLERGGGTEEETVDNPQIGSLGSECSFPTLQGCEICEPFFNCTYHPRRA